MSPFLPGRKSGEPLFVTFILWPSFLADADAERFVKAVDTVSKDPAGDALLAIIAPQGLADPTTTAKEMTTRLAR